VIDSIVSKLADFRKKINNCNYNGFKKANIAEGGYIIILCAHDDGDDTSDKKPIILLTRFFCGICKTATIGGVSSKPEVSPIVVGPSYISYWSDCYTQY
jgi:hypothetical protein